MDKSRLYHNPNCSKSRGAMAILAETGLDIDVVEYLKEPLDADSLRSILSMLDESPDQLVRKDNHFRELGLDESDYTEAGQVVELLVHHPRLMQRPIFVHNGKAVIGRPSEKVSGIL